MRNLIIIVIIVSFCSCKNYKIEPTYMEKDFTIDTFNNKLVVSYKSEHYVSYKIFDNSSCHPRISYHSRYFEREPFFAYRTIPLNIDSGIVFIDFYGKGIDSLNYEELEILFYLSGKQTIKLHKVFILDECNAIGNEVTTSIIKRKELTRIAKEWNLIVSK